MSEVRCPYCAAPQPAAAGIAGGAALECIACDRSFLRPQLDDARQAPPSPAASPSAARAATGRARSEALPAPVTGLLALVGTTIFYVGIVHPLEATRFGELFAARGWVPYGVTGLAVWSLVVLADKLVRVRRQRRVLDLDVLPVAPDARITRDACEPLLEHLGALDQDHPGNELVDRLRRALRLFQARGQVREVVDQLSTEARAADLRVEGSYTLLRVFIWAIPILGFIGTVLGIGAAVGGFSATVDAAASLEGMKSAIGGVTGGLGLAFDTTLLALAVSIVIMFPTSALQRLEEGWLAEVDDFCQDALVTRLDEPAGGIDVARLERAVDRLTDALSQWSQRMPGLEGGAERGGPEGREATRDHTGETDA